VSPRLLVAGIAVGLCSSVSPHVTDQLEMARLRRATFALMLALLPPVVAGIGWVVLGQVPTWYDAAGVGLVILGLLVHVADDASRSVEPTGGPAWSTDR
jgi:inner membrane transporter RhtA